MNYRVTLHQPSFSHWTSLVGPIVVGLTLALVPAGSASAGWTREIDKASLDWINRQTAPGVPLTDAQALFVVLMVDPPAPSLTEIHFSMTYDPSRYTFRSDRSGLVCAFSVGGDCPAPATVYGTHRATDLPYNAFKTGTPLPGSVFTMLDDPFTGLLTLSYLLATPLDLGGEPSNVFAISFEALVPYIPYQTAVTFYNTPGNYDFNQVDFGCTTTQQGAQCGSNNPVTGINVDTGGFSVPEPSSLALMLSAGTILFAVRRRIESSLPQKHAGHRPR